MLHAFRSLCIALTLLACSGSSLPGVRWPSATDLAKCAPPAAELAESVLDVLAAAPAGRPDLAALAELEQLAREHGPGAVLCAVQTFAKSEQAGVASAESVEPGVAETAAAVLAVLERVRPAAAPDAASSLPDAPGAAGGTFVTVPQTREVP